VKPRRHLEEPHSPGQTTGAVFLHGAQTSQYAKNWVAFLVIISYAVTVNVISRRRLRQFYDAKPERRQHAGAFEDWFRLARKARWRTFQDARSLFGQSDIAKDTASRRTATIFDIGGNKYRIVTLIDYARQTVLIAHVMDHKEYDKGLWKYEI
jgi:mRNA interferase HigB